MGNHQKPWKTATFRRVPHRAAVEAEASEHARGAQRPSSFAARQQLGKGEETQRRAEGAEQEDASKRLSKGLSTP